jgi:hypothetical protein
MTIIHSAVEKLQSGERSITKAFTFAVSVVLFLMLHLVTFAALLGLTVVSIPLYVHPKTRPVVQELLLELEAYL